MPFFPSSLSLPLFKAGCDGDVCYVLYFLFCCKREKLYHISRPRERERERERENIKTNIILCRCIGKSCATVVTKCVFSFSLSIIHRPLFIHTFIYTRDLWTSFPIFQPKVPAKCFEIKTKCLFYKESSGSIQEKLVLLTGYIRGRERKVPRC